MGSNVATVSIEIIDGALDGVGGIAGGRDESRTAAVSRGRCSSAIICWGKRDAIGSMFDSPTTSLLIWTLIK